MALACTLVRLFVILLGLSCLRCLRAVPVSRTESLNVRGPQVHLTLENTHKVITDFEREWHWEEPTISERMNLELLHDYPPSGANNRHTPRAP